MMEVKASDKNMKKIVEIVKKKKVLSLMLVLSFLWGSFLAFLNIRYSLRVDFGLNIGLFLPCLGFIFIIFLTNKYYNKKYTKLISNITLVIYIIFLMFYYPVIIFLSALNQFMDPVTDLKYYNNLEKIVNDEKIFQVFPRKIPDDGENVAFLYSPGLLQAGTEIYLYYVDKKMNIDDFVSKFEEDAEWIGYLDDYNEKKGLFSSNAFDLVPMEDKDNLKIYLMESECDSSGYCNHGYYLLMALNEKTKEVLFELSDW